MTYSGSQVQDNLHVPTCYPGIVRVRGQEISADPAKVLSVDLKSGKAFVKACGTGTKSKLNFGEKPRKWVDAQVTDLQKLREPGETHPFSLALAGIGVSGCRPMVSANSPYNQAKALMCRAFRQPKPNDWGRGPAPRERNISSVSRREIGSTL